MEQYTAAPRTREFSRPVTVGCPYKSAYEYDVVVCGCGFAGLNAAVAAREKGNRVLVVDKGRPGYSGAAPWAGCFRWFDQEHDDADAYRKAVMTGGEYLCNMDWIDIWMQESKAAYERLKDWGILSRYPTAKSAGNFHQTQDFAGYREAFDKFDRHKKWVDVLKRYEIPFLQHTMVTDVIVDGGKVKGVMGLHVPSGQVITVHAKAVILATGGGCIRSAGHPVGGNTFDGEYIAYQLGLPITGKEFEDFHSTSSAAPGNPFFTDSWVYLENFWICGGDITGDNVDGYVAAKGKALMVRRVENAVNGVEPSEGIAVLDLANAPFTIRGASKRYGVGPDELRSGTTEDSGLTPAKDIHGAAIGTCSHLSSGVFCGLEDRSGDTGIPGLFVAGDGIHASSPAGATYPCGVGFTSCFCSIDGDHAGKAAGEYAMAAETDKIPDQIIVQKTQEILAPMHVEKGFDANWARDVLLSIMAPYWVSVAKSEPMLQAALTQVRYMRQHVIPRLTARSGHDLRLCIEMKHKALASELKLLASLERKESRGSTYRIDHPYRDDENFLCYLTLRKGANDEICVEKVPVKDAWTGDRAQEYFRRYLYYFPGEPEAKGFTVEGKPQKPLGGGDAQ